MSTSHHLVAGDERVADQRIEVGRGGAVDHREVAAADARQRGRSRTQSGVGSGSDSFGSTASAGRPAAPAPGMIAPASRAQANSRRLAREDQPHCELPSCVRAPASIGPSGSSTSSVPQLAFRPMLHQPAALAGDRGEAGLGVDGDREADGFEHRQVAGRVGVGDRSPPAEGLRQRSSRPGSGRGSRRWAVPARGGRCRCRRA